MYIYIYILFAKQNNLCFLFFVTGHTGFTFKEARAT